MGCKKLYPQTSAKQWRSDDYSDLIVNLQRAAVKLQGTVYEDDNKTEQTAVTWLCVICTNS